MACKRAKHDAAPVWAQQGLSGGIASYSSGSQLRDKVRDGAVPVGMADFDEDGVHGEELRVGADAVDGVLCIVA